jgi:hypothetical protein
MSADGTIADYCIYLLVILNFFKSTPRAFAYGVIRINSNYPASSLLFA